jgi:hypothetical protein
VVRFSFLTFCEFGVWCDHSRDWQFSLTSLSLFRHSSSIVFVSHLRQGGGNVVPKLWHHSPSHILSLSHHMNHYIISYNYYIHPKSLIPIYNFSFHKPYFAVSTICPEEVFSLAFLLKPIELTSLAPFQPCYLVILTSYPCPYRPSPK